MPHRSFLAPRRLVPAVVALAAVVVARLLLGATSAGLVLDGLLALAVVGATLDAATRARGPRSVLAWRCQTAAAGAWVLAPLAWLTGLPDGLATAARIGFVVLAGAGWWLTSLGTDPWSRVRLVTDGGLAASAAFIVGWPLVLRSVVAEQGGGAAAAFAVTVALGAVAVASVVVGLALTEMQPARRVMPALSCAGFLVVAASDVAWGVGATPLWAAGFALAVLATRVYAGTSQRREVMSTRRTLVHAPYLLLVPAIVALALQHVGAGIEPETTVAAIAMVSLLLVRQHATLSENRGLVERLAVTERLLRHQATHDALTGLAGRVLLYELLDDELARTRRAGLAVVFIDLDDFKTVNDTLGHGAGDDVLVQTARRLVATLAPLGAAATAVRMSGDEFAVVLVGEPAHRAQDVARQILDEVKVPMTVTGHEVRITASIGVAVAAPDVADASALLRAADLAMYRVKHDGKCDVEQAVGVVGGSAELPGR